MITTAILRRRYPERAFFRQHGGKLLVIGGSLLVGSGICLAFFISTGGSH